MGQTDKNTGGFNINVNSPGNFIAENITFEAPVYIGGGNEAVVQNNVANEQMTTAEDNQQVKRTAKSMGRPMAEELARCFKEGVDAGACIERMRPYIVGEKGKQVVLVLKAAYRLEWFEKMPIFPQLVREYGELGRSSGFNEQMRNGFFSDDEVETMMQKLKQ